MKTAKVVLIHLSILMLFSSCDIAGRIEKRAEQVNNYERAALALSKESRNLKAKISTLEFEIQSLRSQKNYLKIQLDKKKSAEKIRQRKIASLAPQLPENNLVQFNIYKWKPDQMLAVAEDEFDNKNFEKSAQFFHAFALNFPKNEKLNDHFMFNAGLAAFESGDHHDWTLYHLGKLIKDYPTSPFYRGAKLWMGITYLKQGHKDKFFNTVEEFRKKYRNTAEWKILSAHYERIVQKYKK